MKRLSQQIADDGGADRHFWASPFACFFCGGVECVFFSISPKSAISKKEMAGVVSRSQSNVV